ncbi:DUF222 domain-containing protein [Nocardia sp. CS682]|uniref:DUF222 domain-containing protein n=1 Tax=Nocardia sp. CS682 TaxID=1047172 RepID=UPI00107579F9|nr:DUF222 domain-containing protein [Nocardia sp. CS682]QBS40814.1 hypothetical protein DMB37_12505 [Nocardia sp. CS682]
MFEGSGSSVLDFQAMSDEGLIEALRTAHGASAAAQAAEVFAVRELYRRHRAVSAEPGPGGVRAGEFAAAEAAVALQVDEGSAAAMIDVGLALEDWLPRTRAEFAAGRIDLAKVRVIIDSTRAVARDVLGELEPRLLETAGRTTPVRLRQAARRWAARLDPGGAQRRRERRQDDRDVRIRALQDSMAVFDGVLPAPGAQTVAMRLREMSSQVCAADPRTMPQRRADALVALADGSGRLRCGCGRGARCPKAEVTGDAPRRPLIQIGIPADSLLGMQDAPAFLAGYGPIDAGLARMLAENARFQVIPEQPDADEPVDKEQVARSRAARVERAARLEREVRALDGMCRFPGCTMPAAESELDQRESATRAEVTVLCPRHHRLKTLADKRKVPWETWLADPDRLQWTTPTGDVHTTSREGARYLFPHKDIDAPTCRSDNPPQTEPARNAPDDLAYPFRGHPLVHRHLCRIAPEDEIPDDTTTPVLNTAY